MAYFLFLDESGQDRSASPYEVLAGISVEDRDVWNLIDAIKAAEERILGLRYSREKGEVKGKKFLKRKSFRQAAQAAPLEPERRRMLARECALHGDAATREQLTAMGQAKLPFVAEVFDLCARFHCYAFASIGARRIAALR